MESKILTPAIVNSYRLHLVEEERSGATIEKYTRDIWNFYRFLPRGKLLCKQALIHYKAALQDSHKPSSINSMLVAIHGLLDFMGLPSCKVKLYKMQRRAFNDERRELSKAEYQRLLHAAQTAHNDRLLMLMQTLCATGIRVSEHPYVTVKAVQQGTALISSKGKIREILFTKELRALLLGYCKRHGIKEGPVFVTRSGKPLNRSYIWAIMKKLCAAAGVAPSKVFPHNLRHLFACTFYAIEKDLVRLADILGHSSIETTRIYTKTSVRRCLGSLEQMHLTMPCRLQRFLI